MNPLTDLLTGHDLFDPPGEREDDETFRARVHAAGAVCESCPLLQRCRDYAANARPAHRSGIWAGTPYDTKGRPVRLPKETQ